MRPTHTLITGASSGLGLELARLFARDGHSLVLVARSGDKLEALAAALRKDHEIDARAFAVDLTAPGAVSDLLASLEQENLGIRAVVNNAGFGAAGPFHGRDWDIYRRMIDLNVGALTELTHSLLPGMLAEAAAGGTEFPLGVLNVASTAAFQPGPGMAAYFASKAYVLYFSEALHEETRGTGVSVTAFCPGRTKTEFFHTESMLPSAEAGAKAPPQRSKLVSMEVEPAARAGYRGFQQNRAVVVPGALNRLLTWAPRLLPRGMVRRVTRRALGR